jgi:zinc transporter
MAGDDALLPNNVRDALVKACAHVSRMGDGTLITLRCINGSTDERPTTGGDACIWMDERLIVSTRQRKCWRWMMWSTI